MNLLVKNNRLVGVEPLDGPANKNLLCVKENLLHINLSGQEIA